MKSKHFYRGSISQSSLSKYTKHQLTKFMGDKFAGYEYLPNIEVGDYSYGLPEVYWYGEIVSLKIGKFCSIAKETSIFLGGEHPTRCISQYPFESYAFEWKESTERDMDVFSPSKGDVIIGNDVWIGAKATILSGVEVGDGAVIGACSVVSKNVPPYSIVVGNPARIIRKRFTEQQIESLMKVKWWDWEKEEINEIIPLIRSDSIEEFFHYCEFRK